MSDHTPNKHTGMPHEQIATATNIPPIPDGFRAPGAPDAALKADCEPTYREVKFHGNYGMLCGQYQEFTRQNITESQISEIGWAAFGTCGWKADRC